jgi:NAD(P)-dependent dehydrogenase (short-subunit alcohol dehydrogenase family)
MSGFARYPSLQGRIVLVTGGATGIGAELVRQFAAQGSRVAFLDIAEEDGRALADDLAAAVAAAPLFLACDLRDVASLRARIAEIAGRLGPVEVLVNNAANDTRQDFAEVSVEDYEWAMQVNLRHVFFAIQAVLPHMQERSGGSIVNMSSIAWMGGGPRLAAYSAAKAAIVGLTNSLAKELGPANIRVNAIAPGAVLTERQLRLWFDAARVEEVVARQCLKRRLEEDEIARLALFLAADDSRMITKQCFTVDAGLR